MFCFLFLSFFSGCLRGAVRSAERLYVPPIVVPNESAWLGSTGLGRSDHRSLFCSEVMALRVSSPNYLTFSACLSSSAYQSIFQRRTAPLSPAPVPFKGHRWSDAPPATGAAALTLFHPLWSEEKEYRMRTRRNALTLWLWCSSLPCTVALARRSAHKTRAHTNTCSHTSYGRKNTKKEHFIFKVCFLCMKQVQNLRLCFSDILRSGFLAFL